MARRSFGGGAADFVAKLGIGQILAVMPGQTLTMWTAVTGGSQVTDLLDASSNACTTVTSDAFGNVPRFSGPADGTAVLWADAGGGSRVALHATDTEARVATLEAAPAGGVQSVAGKTGTVSLVKADVGLGSVDNTADASKPVSTAQAAADAAVQAAAVQRSNHTGTQTASTISDFNTAAVAAGNASYLPFKTAALNPDLLISGAITRDSNGAALSAPVAWPDGTPGTYTADTVSAAFPGAVDAYHITYGSPPTKTYTQPAVTRDAATGAVTNRPALTVA